MAAPEKLYVLVEINTRTGPSAKAEEWAWHAINSRVRAEQGEEWGIKIAVGTMQITSAFVEEEGVLRKIYTGE